MSREKLIQQTFESGGEYRGQYDLHQFTSEELERFAAAIRAATKEEDARIADSFYHHIRQYTTDVPDIGGAIRASK